MANMLDLFPTVIPNAAFETGSCFNSLHLIKLLMNSSKFAYAYTKKAHEAHHELMKYMTDLHDRKEEEDSGQQAHQRFNALS